MSWETVFWILLALSLLGGVLIMLDRSADLYRVAKLAAFSWSVALLAGAAWILGGGPW